MGLVYGCHGGATGHFSAGFVLFSSVSGILLAGKPGSSAAGNVCALVGGICAFAKLGAGFKLAAL